MAKTISRDTPLAELTLRKYEKPQSSEKRELVRKLCLSLGLLQPGDSRDVIVDVFQVILENCSNGEGATSAEIERMTIQNRKNYSLPLMGIAPSNIRRQILRLKDMFIVERIGTLYRINENASLKDLFDEKILKYYMNSIISRIKEYVAEVDNAFLSGDENKEEG